MGRPLKFKSPEELEELAKEYFALRTDEMGYPLLNDAGQVKYPITWTGLCHHLDTTRETLDDYQMRDEFSDSIKRLKQLVEHYYESRLVYGNATGPIFALKNFGWKDKHETEHSGSLSLAGLIAESQKD